MDRCESALGHFLPRHSAAGAASDAEEDQLGKAWGLEATSRLSCQVRIASADLVIEIPRYTLNIVSEHH